MNRVRDLLACALLFAALGLLYVWLGPKGVAAAGITAAVIVATLGISTGYWIGADPQADALITELMRRLREIRREGRRVE